MFADGYVFYNYFSAQLWIIQVEQQQSPISNTHGKYLRYIR